jgi:hypothetical protein
MTAATPAATPADRPRANADERHARLVDSLRRLRTGAGSGQLDRPLMMTGAVLLPVGLVLILLGWFGASHTTLAFEQVSYLISGGLLGLGLTFAGGFLYFAAWVTRLLRDGREQNERLVREQREQGEQLTMALGRIEELLAAQRRQQRSTPVRARSTSK